MSLCPGEVNRAESTFNITCITYPLESREAYLGFVYVVTVRAIGEDNVQSRRDVTPVALGRGVLADPTTGT
jgi:hypothetical protein